MSIVKFSSVLDWNWEDEPARILTDPKQLKKIGSDQSFFDYKKSPNQVDVHLIALGAYEGTGCFFEGAQVITDTGLVAIERIKENYLVLTHKNNFKPVTTLFSSSYSGEVSNLTIKGMPEPLVSTANHPFFVLTKQKFNAQDSTRHILSGLQVVQAKDLKPGDFLLSPVYPNDNDANYDVKENDDFKLGYVYGSMAVNDDGLDVKIVDALLRNVLPACLFRKSRVWKLNFIFNFLNKHKNEKLSNEEVLVTAEVSRQTAYDVQRFLASCRVPAVIEKQDDVSYVLKIYLSYMSPRTQQTVVENGFSFSDGTIAFYEILDNQITTVENKMRYNIEVADDHSYVVNNIAVHNCNRNFDLFKEAECRKKHNTFVKAGRALHRHHKNKPSDPKYGNIKASAYNEKMKRIELIVGHDVDKCADILDEIEKKGHANYSMASVQAYDVCTYCNHKAANDSERCEHILEKLGEIREDGVVCAMENPDPNWIEISYVKRPADRIGMSLKIATEQVKPMRTSDYLKLYPGFQMPLEKVASTISKKAQDKRQLFDKLAAMEKHISMIGSLPDPIVFGSDEKSTLTKLYSSFEDLPDNVVEELRKHEPKHLLALLAKNGIVFTVKDFLKYLFGDRILDKTISEVQKEIPGSFSKFTDFKDECVNDEKFDPGTSAALPVGLKKMVNSLFDKFSIFDEPRSRKAIKITVVKPRNSLASLVDQLKLGSCKEHTDPGIKLLAKEYLSYKLAALQYMADLNLMDNGIIKHAVVQNLKK